jgi:putative acetyltransferase
LIRKANYEDLSRIAEIIVFSKRVAYRSIFNNDHVTFHELQVVSLLKEYQNTPSIIDHMFVFDDGIVKGVINRTFYDDSIEICELYIEPFFKGCGIGRELIQHVISEAKETKINKIYLWVIKDNMSARKFYERNGFYETGETCPIEGTSKLDLYYEMILC